MKENPCVQCTNFTLKWVELAERWVSLPENARGEYERRNMRAEIRTAFPLSAARLEMFLAELDKGIESLSRHHPNPTAPDPVSTHIIQGWFADCRWYDFSEPCPNAPDQQALTPGQLIGYVTRLSGFVRSQLDAILQSNQGCSRSVPEPKPLLSSGDTSTPLISGDTAEITYEATEIAQSLQLLAQGPDRDRVTTLIGRFVKENPTVNGYRYTLERVKLLKEWVAYPSNHEGDLRRRLMADRIRAAFPLAPEHLESLQVTLSELRQLLTNHKWPGVPNPAGTLAVQNGFSHAAELQLPSPPPDAPAEGKLTPGQLIGYLNRLSAYLQMNARQMRQPRTTVPADNALPARPEAEIPDDDADLSGNAPRFAPQDLADAMGVSVDTLRKYALQANLPEHRMPARGQRDFEYPLVDAIRIAEEFKTHGNRSATNKAIAFLGKHGTENRI